MVHRYYFFLLCVCLVNVARAQAPIDLSSTVKASTAARTHKPLTGILGAFPEEIKFLLTQIQDKKELVIQGIHFTEGVLNGRKVVVAQTGIGKVNAAITTTLMVEHFELQELLFTGIAGGVNPELTPGDLVIGTKIAHHDFGTLTQDSMLRRPTRHPATMIENPLYFRSDSALVKLAIESGRMIKLEPFKHNGKEQTPRIITGTIVTGDVFVSSSAATQHLRKKMNADATEMEGAAVAQVCWQQQVPFIIIRSVSDNAGNSAYNDIKSFYQSAARNSAHLVMAMVQQARVVK